MVKKKLTKKALALRKKANTTKKFERFFGGKGFDARTGVGKLLKNVREFDRKGINNIANYRLNFSAILKDGIYNIEQTWKLSKQGPKAIEKVEKMIKKLRSNVNKIFSDEGYVKKCYGKNGILYYMWEIPSLHVYEYIQEDQLDQLQQNREDLRKALLTIED